MVITFDLIFVTIDFKFGDDNDKKWCIGLWVKK